MKKLIDTVILRLGSASRRIPFLNAITGCFAACPPLAFRQALSMTLFILCTAQLSAQSMFNSPIITSTGIYNASGAGGSSPACPTYDSIGVLRADTATYVIMCCASGCDTLPLIASPGGGAVALWRLQGADVVEVDTTRQVGIGTTTPSYNLEVAGDMLVTDMLTAGYHSAIQLGTIPFAGFNSKGAMLLQYNTDTTLMAYVYAADESGDAEDTVTAAMGWVDANTGVDLAVFLNSTGIHLQRFSETDTAYTEQTIDSSGFTFLTGDSFIVDAGVMQFDDLAGSGTRLVTASATGVLATNPMITGFTIDASSNMYAGTNSLSGLNGGSFNFAAGIEAGSGNNSGTPVKAGNSNTLIGYGSDVSDTIVSGGTAIGFNTIVGEGSLAIGSNIDVSGTNSIGVGASFPYNTSIGFYAAPTDIGQFVALPIDWYLNGVTRTELDADTVSLNAPGTTGSNSIGTVFYINAGAPTGNATPGQLIFQTAPSGASGATVGALAPAGKFDASTTAGDTRFFLYDVDNGTLERVTVGAADSGGAGFKVLRIAN